MVSTYYDPNTKTDVTFDHTAITKQLVMESARPVPKTKLMSHLRFEQKLDLARAETLIESLKTDRDIATSIFRPMVYRTKTDKGTDVLFLGSRKLNEHDETFYDALYTKRAKYLSNRDLGIAFEC